MVNEIFFFVFFISIRINAYVWIGTLISIQLYNKFFIDSKLSTVKECIF